MDRVAQAALSHGAHPRPRHRHHLDDRHPDRRRGRHAGARQRPVDLPLGPARLGRGGSRAVVARTAARWCPSCSPGPAAALPRSPPSASPACCRPSSCSMPRPPAPPQHPAERRPHRRRGRRDRGRGRRRRLRAPHRQRRQPAARRAQAALARTPRAGGFPPHRHGASAPTTTSTARLTGARTVEHNWALESGFLDLASRQVRPRISWRSATSTPPCCRRSPASTRSSATSRRAAAAATGLAAGTPVVAGCADHVASAFVAGIRADGDLLIKFGGAGDILLATDRPQSRPAPVPRLSTSSPACSCRTAAWPARAPC